MMDLDVDNPLELGPFFFSSHLFLKICPDFDLFCNSLDSFSCNSINKQEHVEISIFIYLIHQLGQNKLINVPHVSSFTPLLNFSPEK